MKAICLVRKTQEASKEIQATLARFSDARDLGNAREKIRVSEGAALSALSGRDFFERHTRDLASISKLYQTGNLRYVLPEAKRELANAFSKLHASSSQHAGFFKSPFWHELLVRNAERTYFNDELKEKLRDEYVAQFHAPREIWVDSFRTLTRRLDPCTTPWTRAIHMMWSKTQFDHMQFDADCLNYASFRGNICWLYYFYASVNPATFQAICRMVQEFLAGPRHPRPAVVSSPLKKMKH